MASRRGRDPRERIIEAAWAAVDEAGPEQLLGGVSLRDVAKRLGVSPSTVTYHFSGPAELGRAMADALFSTEWQLPHDRAAAALLADLPFGEAVRAAAQANWDELTEEWSVVYERRLMRLFAATGDHEGGREATARLRDIYFALVEEANVVLFDEVLERHGRRWIEPFTSGEVARVASAVLEQLLQQWIVDPDSVRPDLGVDAVVAMISGLTVDGDHHRGVEEVQASLDAGSGSDPGDGDGAGELAGVPAARAAAAAAAALFIHGVAGVTLTDVAHACGRPVAELTARFGTPDRVAAVAFARHLDDVEEAGTRRRAEDPVLGLLDLLCELVRRARVDPGCARALLCERIVGCSGEDLRTLVPLDRIVEHSVRAALPEVAEPALASALVAD
ncbi:MAG: TetR/AcrR family transcriptional regulator, partial [Microthrixaceae bacterium]